MEWSYENSLKYYRDLKNVIDTTRDEGREEGVEIGVDKGIRQTARNLLQMKMMSDIQIAEATGLTVAEIERLKCE